MTTETTVDELESGDTINIGFESHQTDGVEIEHEGLTVVSAETRGIGGGVKEVAVEEDVDMDRYNSNSSQTTYYVHEG